MPLVSKAQQGFLFTHHPEIAKRWAAETPDLKHLPQHVDRQAAVRQAVRTKLRAAKP